MQFEKSEGTAGLERALLAALNESLTQQRKVLWLIPGGSNIAIAVAVMDNIAAELTAHLTVMLTDERYGSPGHPDSNYAQLIKAGFDPSSARFKDMLTGQDFDTTVQNAEDAYARAFTDAEHIIGFFGMGADGHTAGILPQSPAATADEKWVVGYDAGTYRRITLTPFALSHVKEAFAGAFGPEKMPALQRLRDEMVPLYEQPAQIFRHLPSVTIFNNQIGAL